MQGHPALPTIRIARPCNSSWDLMQGDDRVRHCSNCDRDVYSSAGLSREELWALVHEREGRLCMRLYRRPDGTLVTGDCGDARAVAKPGFLHPGAAWVVGAWMLGGVSLAAVIVFLLANAYSNAMFNTADAGEIDHVDANL